jgi:predicted nucleotide-binding protein
MATAQASDKQASVQPSTTEKRNRLSQSDVPGENLSSALRVASAIADSYGKSPTKPLRVAEAMDISPQSSGFRRLCGASIAYGLTEGGYNSELIALTPLARRIVAPTRDGDDFAAKREALLRPRVIREFLTRYNDSRLPTEPIARNVLEEMGVPAPRTGEVYALIVEGARELGFLRDFKGSTHVDLDQVEAQRAVERTVGDHAEAEAIPAVSGAPEDSREQPATALRRGSGRVFITHGKNKEILGQLKDLLTFGGFTPVVAIETESASKPVPDKVLDDMKSCDAAIIHIGTEMKLMDADGKERKMLNQNVLIEIGAAMAFYGRKFILLVEDGATLPSNLQGLYEVRYEGEKLDYDATMKLLKAFADFRG